MQHLIKKLSGLFIFLAVVVLLLPGCIPVDWTVGPTSVPSTTVPVNGTSVPPTSTWTAPPQTSSPELANWVEAVEKARPSVVAVETATGSASGWIIDSSGIIVTNEHVVEGLDRVSVALHDGRYFESTAIYTDVVTDIAVIIIQADNLPAASVGSSSSLQVGQPVAVIGNALGLGISMKGGWVSRLNVSTTIQGRALYGLIETDAAMNPGNSGGPLVNQAGEVVGIANAKLVSDVVEGVAYAISIDSALQVIEQLVQKGSITYPFLGVQGLLTVTPAVAGFYDIKVQEGVLVLNIVPGSGAEAAGLEPRDVLLEFDGEPVLTVERLVQAVRSKQPGQTVSVRVDRNGEVLTFEVTLTQPIS